MPPRRSRPVALQARKRKQRIRERDTVRNLERLDLASTTIPTAVVALDTTGRPRDMPSRDIVRNYDPSVNLDNVTIAINLVYGPQCTPFPDLELKPFETTMGRVNTIGQIRGMLINSSAIRNTLKKTYKLNMNDDIVSTAILYGDGAGQVFRAKFEERWETTFGVWAGEVESGQRPAVDECRCGDGGCKHYHGPLIQVRFRYAKVAPVLGLDQTLVIEDEQNDDAQA